MLTLITLPFIMVTDLFPFMRFGMFAEPIRHEIQKEYFQIVVYPENNKEKNLNPQLIGIENHFYEYITRNYFYRGEGVLLLQKVESLLPFPCRKLELNRFSRRSGLADTTIIFKPE